MRKAVEVQFEDRPPVVFTSQKKCAEYINAYIAKISAINVSHYQLSFQAGHIPINSGSDSIFTTYKWIFNEWNDNNIIDIKIFGSRIYGAGGYTKIGEIRLISRFTSEW